MSDLRAELAHWRREAHDARHILPVTDVDIVEARQLTLCADALRALLDKHAAERCPKCGGPIEPWIPVYCSGECEREADATRDCDRKFIDSNRCLKCGWEPQKL